MVEADSHLGASYILIKHIKIKRCLSTLICCPWAYSSSHTHTSRLCFWGSWSFVDSKYYHYVMVEVESHFKLLPASILDIYIVFEHIDMMSMGIQ
jgi:hypothetical protein